MRTIVAFCVVWFALVAPAPAQTTTDLQLVLAVDVSGSVSPLLRSRLGIRLPTKYPGQILRSDSFGIGARARVGLARTRGPVAIGAAVTVNGARGYRRSARYTERGLGADLFVTLRR